jgi:glycosyltransferase involved in cell wall biosynthesis
MRVFLNGLAANAGAGLTYLHNVVPSLASSPGVRTTLAIQPSLREKFKHLVNVQLVGPSKMLGTTRRFLFEQCALPGLIRNSGADILISAGNFALRRSPVPQILLSGNSLYTSADFYRDLRSRREYSMMIDTFARGLLAKRSVRWADQTVAPSKAYAEELGRCTGTEVSVVHHGFNRGTFFAGTISLSTEVSQKIRDTEGCLRLLFVTHYNYYRNFETLLRAVPIMQKQLARKVKLFLTCKLERSANPGAYNPQSAAELIHTLGISDNVVQLGTVPYECLHHLYRACDIYVSAAYAETFAHPLVEAMASRLPIVASDLPVHREVCRDAALYFPRFSPEHLANAVARLDRSPDLRDQLSTAGLQRSSGFSWNNHVEQLLDLASRIRKHQSELSGKYSLCTPFSHPVIDLAGDRVYSPEPKS